MTPPARAITFLYISSLPLFKETRVTLAHLILADASDSDAGPAMWWWITLLIVLGAGLILYFFYYFLIVRLPLWILRHTIYRLHVHGARTFPRRGRP